MTAYDHIGHGYASRRRPDPRIAAVVEAALEDARTVVNVGAGTGSYEPADRCVVAVEPSPVMIAQRPPHGAPVVVAAAERLPFADAAFAAGMAVLTIHHWTRPRQGCEELRRVVRGPIAILTCEPAVANAMWLMQDYAPEIAAWDAEHFPSTAQVARWLGGARVETIAVPADCSDGFLMSFWNHPERVVDPAARAATSGLARLPRAVQDRIAHDLGADLDSGAWDARHGHLRSLDSFDAGLRLVVGRGA